MNVRAATLSRIGTGLLGLAAVVGCSIDFSEAIPCESSAECPSDRVCDTNFRRCVASGLVEEDVTQDPDRPPRPDVADEDTDNDVDDVLDDATDADADDVADDAEDVEPGDTDDDGDTPVVVPDGDDCVPSPEVCDGVDNDCNGLIDDGGVCDGPCLDGQVRVTDGGIDVCIDQWEASRADATADSPGTSNARATSRPGVLPWSFATFDQASSACAAAGKRICTAAEWQMACASSEEFFYPYDRRLYNGTTCNGLNVDPRTAPATTGAFTGCVSPNGVNDMSGNVAEWIDDRRAAGGAYNSVQANLRCQSVNADVNPTISDATIGFRCCRTPAGE